MKEFIKTRLAELSYLLFPTPTKVNQDLDQIIFVIKTRSKKKQFLAINYLGAVIIIIAGGLYLFQNSEEQSRLLYNRWTIDSTELDASSTVDLNARKYDETQLYLLFFNSLTIKIGSVLITLFLVQMLLRVHRYNIRLAAYYQARADALELCKHSGIDGFKELVASLSPDGIDVGISKTPTGEFLGIVKSAPK